MTCFDHTGQNCELEKLLFLEIINGALFLLQ